MPSFPRYSRRHGRTNSTDPGDFHRRMLEERLRDPDFRAEYERVRAELFAQFAPATEGPVVKPGRRRTGHLIFGDADA